MHHVQRLNVLLAKKDLNRKDTLKNYKKMELLLPKVGCTMHIVQRQEPIFLAKSS